MLDQNETGKLLKRCDGDPIAIEEVLSAYVVWKYLKGRPPGHILSKLRYLTIYLQVTCVPSSPTSLFLLQLQKS